MTIGEKLFSGSASRRQAPVTSAPEPDPERSQLMIRREELAQELAQLQFDLGGLVYEMAIRDHYRLDTLTRVAARQQELDGELGEVERLLRMEQGGASGSCPSCGALHSRGAVYCWQCGQELMVSRSAT